MKIHLMILLSLLNALFLRAQKDKDFVPLVHNQMKEQTKLIFVCKYEVSNGQYRQFLKSLLTMGQTEKYNLCLYDSLAWRRAFKTNGGDPMLEYYSSHPAFDQYPIVNITKEAAQAYCNWQTKTYHAQLSRKFKKVVFRLPTELEWLRFASPLPNHNLPWQGNMPYTNPKGKPVLCNIKFHWHGIDVCYDCDGYPFQAPVKEYPPINSDFTM
ncbi:hypothetical protein DR864_28305 (plasmid) [Runella rosea]|uniref:Sulfatase-modifying factor enzyme-like domain-containing protein n=1 Tax=Runella rosea TaxID=2259595 RepID=A0A344TT08_9BACT|nr:SUMF1/EgtB/PvdO family nonheme iron enzyme [Runella rosea]AXE21779.1 hypothetical protein DR864_28305 [Runella rosea]